MAVGITNTAVTPGPASIADVITFASSSIGTASADRIIVIGFVSETSAGTPVSATIDYGSGDTAMTAGTLANFVNMSSRLFWLAVPTGTTAVFKVTVSAAFAANVSGIIVYAVTGAASTPASSGIDTSTDMDATNPLTTGSVTIPTDGGFIGVAAGATSTGAKTWANATEDVDEANSGFRRTSASRTTAGTVTITCTGSNNEDGALAWIIFDPDSSASAAITGTATASITEADVVAGAKTIIITLTGDTWLTAGALFDAIRSDIIQGLDSAQSETVGWNNEVRDKQGVSGVVRTSNTVVTITLDAQAAYNITAQETITVTVPITALTTSLSPITATPTFTVDQAVITGTGALASGAATIAGSGTTASTGTGALQAQAADITGAGLSASTGTGALAAQAATITGTGIGTSTGTGVLVAGAATIAGTGEVGDPTITGTGALVAGAAAIAGSGLSASLGTGVLAAQSAVIAGTGVTATFGAGALAAGDASMSGVGTVGAEGPPDVPPIVGMVANFGTLLYRH